MFFWTGAGWLVIAIFIASFAIPTWVANAITTGYGDAHNWPSALGLVIGGVLLFILGRALNQGHSGPTPRAGAPLQSRPTHSFMFLRMEWWGPVLVAAAVVFSRL